MLLMLSAAPLGVSYSYAENEENNGKFETLTKPNEPSIYQNEGNLAILTEKIVDGRLETRQFSLPQDVSREDLSRILPIEGTSAWTYVNYKPYHSGIVLFDGKVSKMGDRYWKISVNGTMNLSKGEINLHLSGQSNNSESIKEKFPSEDLDYRVIFSGKMVESDQEDAMIMAFMNSNFSSDSGKNIKFPHVENTNSEPGNSNDCYQKVRNMGFGNAITNSSFY